MTRNQRKHVSGDSARHSVSSSDVDDNSDGTERSYEESDPSIGDPTTTVEEDRIIAELAATIFSCAVKGTDTGITGRCVTVMSELRRIPHEGSKCSCIHCFMQPHWRRSLVAKMNGECGAYAWKFEVQEPSPVSSLVERTWEHVSKLIDEWGQLVGSQLCLDNYRTTNISENGKSFSPLEAVKNLSGNPCAGVDGMAIMAVGSEAMLNGAGMEEQYPGTGDYIEEMILYDPKHVWIDCAGGLDWFGEFDTFVCPLEEANEYACVSHTWGRGWCKGEGPCDATDEYREKHVCKWGPYWDERDVVEAVINAGWDGALWLDWVDIPTQKGNKKANKIKTQAELFAGAARVFVFVPDDDFESIDGALRLSETAATTDDLVDMIHLLSRVRWFSSEWTLQEMFLSYGRMMVVCPGNKSIGCGWLEKLRIRLAALLDEHWMDLKKDDMADLNALGILELGPNGRLFTAALMRCRGIAYKMTVFDSIRDGLVPDVPGLLPACAQLVSRAVQDHDISWLAFMAKSAEGSSVPVRTIPFYGAEWPAPGRWRTVCDILTTGAGLLWFGAMGTIRLPECIRYWYDDDVASELEVAGDSRVTVLCVRDANTPCEVWLGLLVSGDSGRTQRTGGCVLRPSQIKSFKSGAVLVL